MSITSPEVIRTVHDYDFVFLGGMFLPITLDHGQGDTIVEGPTAITIHLASKPNKVDKSRPIPAEDITIYVSQVASVTRRVREVVELSPEQKFEWERTIQEMSGTIQ